MTKATTSDRPGQRFQDFVARLEQMLAHREGLRVRSPERLRDKDTGRLREHDVVITRTDHQGTSRTAIECRDHRRAVGVPQVEAFAKKCEKTSIHRGIIVSASGFTRTARTKAAALNLACMDLAKALTFDWIGAVNLVCQYYELVALDVAFAIQRDGAEPVQPVTVHEADGSLYTGADLRDVIFNQLPSEARAIEQSQTFEGRLTVAIDGRYVLDATGTRFAAPDAVVRYILRVDVAHREVELHRYAGEAGALEIASGEFAFPDARAAVALVKSPNGFIGYVTSTNAFAHYVQIGDAPLRRLEPNAVP